MMFRPHSNRLVLVTTRSWWSGRSAHGERRDGARRPPSCLLYFFETVTILALVLAGPARADWIDWNVNTAIPDHDEMGVQDTHALSGFSGPVATLEVRLRFTGDPLAYNGDLFVTLQSDNGGYAVLLNRVGRITTDPLGYADNGFDITFALGGDDIHLYQGFTPTYDGSGRLTGTWGADARNVDPDSVLDTDDRTADLDQFAGVNPNGNWTLFVADLNLNGTATLDSWGLNVTIVPEPATLGLLALGGLGLLLVRRR